jgi:hypothetical protein
LIGRDDSVPVHRSEVLQMTRSHGNQLTTPIWTPESHGSSQNSRTDPESPDQRPSAWPRMEGHSVRTTAPQRFLPNHAIRVHRNLVPAPIPPAKRHRAGVP